MPARFSFKPNKSIFFIFFLISGNFPSEEVMEPNFWQTLYEYRPNICQLDSLSKQIKVSIFLFSVFQETWYKFIDFSFPSEEVMGPNFWRKFFFLPWLIRMFPQHWRTFKYTLMIAVNVVLQVRTQCCVLTGNCPVKFTITYCKNYVHNGAFGQELIWRRLQYDYKILCWWSP